MACLWRQPAALESILARPPPESLAPPFLPLLSHRQGFLRLHPHLHRDLHQRETRTMVSHAAGARGSLRHHWDFGRGRHVFIRSAHQPVSTSISYREGIVRDGGSTFLTCDSPVGKLAPGNAEIDKAFKDMWAEAEKNRTKWSCESPPALLTFLTPS